MRSRVVTVFIVAISSATVANAQAAPGGPLPGSGDSTKISSGNRETNADYNHLIGSTGAKQATDVKVKSKHGAVPATPADVKVGATVRGSDGIAIGTIASLDANQAVLDTGQVKIGVPLIGFGKDDAGLMLNITAAKFGQLAAEAHARSQAQAQPNQH